MVHFAHVPAQEISTDAVMLMRALGLLGPSDEDLAVKHTVLWKLAGM